MLRRVLTDKTWSQIQQTMKSKGLYETKNGRAIMEAIIWKLRTGAPWRDIPSELCSWKTAYNRFNRWAKKGLWEDFFFELRGEIDQEWIFIDGSYISVHQHASGARIGEERAIGKSRGGFTTKLHMAADAHGNPIYFEITGGEVHDSQEANKLIDNVGEINNIIADKAYDSKSIRDHISLLGGESTIPRRSNSREKDDSFDSYIYKLRHLVENLFARLKHFRSIGARFEKLARNFKSMVYLACTLIWLKIGR